MAKVHGSDGRYIAQPPERCFWEKVDKGDGSGCWLWTGTRITRGYGQLKFGDSYRLAHRMAYEMLIGPIPDGQWVLHRCDVRHCVRPDHLFLGNVAINQADMKTKGRSARGERQGRSKLTAEQVHEIRAAGARGEMQRVIAARYGISRSAVGLILNGTNWYWLP
jgi:HNH endonuclease